MGSLVLGHTLPIIEIMSKIELLSSPETCLSLLVHVPDILVLDGEQNESVLVLLQKPLGLELSVHLLLLHIRNLNRHHLIRLFDLHILKLSFRVMGIVSVCVCV